MVTNAKYGLDIPYNIAPSLQISTILTNMLEYNEIKEGRYIIFDGDPYAVISSHVFRKQQRKPVNATKLKNLISGRMVEHSFHQSDKADEADIEKTEIVFIYSRDDEFWFHEADNKSARFTLSSEQVGDQLKFLKAGMVVTALMFDEKPVGVQLPIKVDLEVTEAPPNVKGDSARGGNKQVVVETGAVVSAPLFINVGDVIRINTQTGEYAERTDKK